MNADAFRHFYEYHFAENLAIWEQLVLPLTQEQFIQRIDYSLGSIHNHVVHLMSVDDTWFCGLRGVEIPPMLNPVHFHRRDKIRAHWDRVERDMRAYLAGLRDDMLFDKPFGAGEDQDLIVWQVLLHVVNHGTDHRAQILRAAHDLGLRTPPQDYIFYVYDHP